MLAAVGEQAENLDRPVLDCGEAAGTRVTRNGVSYEMAFFAVYRAMGVALSAGFAAVYAGEQPDPTPYPKPFVPTPELWAQPESRLPMSYERHMVRSPVAMACGCTRAARSGHQRPGRNPAGRHRGRR